MLLTEIQQQIEQMYKIGIGITIDDYLISEKRCESILKKKKVQLSKSASSNGIMFLHQSDEELNIGVYLDKAILSIFSTALPFTLTEKNINSFCTAIEEISHFVYAAWNAQNCRQITQFELELQAEVDKYLTTLFYYKERTPALIPDNLQEKLFFNISYDSRLADDEIRRYQKANKAAYRYCRFLESTYIKERNFSLLFSDIRIFYRLSQNRKLEYIRERCGH